MSEQTNGGPAFPCVKSWHVSKHGYEAAGGEEGMSLRDYFAAKTMQGFAADPEMGTSGAEEIAALAYAWADAMLKAREVGQ